MGKFRIDTLWKAFMMLKQRSHFFNLQLLHIIYKYNCMRISHGYPGHTIFQASHLDRFIHDSFAKPGNRNLPCFQDGTAHIHLYQFDFPVFHNQIDILDSA